MDIPATKNRLRKTQAVVRDGLSPEIRKTLSAQFAQRFAGFLEGCDIGSISFYWPMRSELDVRALMARLAVTGWRIALPRMSGPGRPLKFHLFTDENDLVEGSFGVREPDETAELITPDIVVAPMLAFDSRGFRLGYGGGFYDRTLEKLRSGGQVLAIGAAFETQKVDHVPTDEFDQKLDAVITDAAVYWEGKT